MTGFGVTRKQGEASSLEVSVKSVNGRFLESRIHLPREFYMLEPEIKKMITEFIGRGTVDVFVQRKAFGKSSSYEVEARSSLAKEWLKAYKKLGKELKMTAKIDLLQIARLPEMMLISESKGGLEKEGQEILALVKESLLACVAEREREGKSLQRELGKMLADLRSHIQQMTTLRVEANQLLEERFKTKLQLRMGEIQMDPQRLAHEIVVQLEKADIDEELTRLEEHFINYEKLLKSSVAEGKKLDFYTQELLREVNTIGSKSQVAKLTNTVVVAKTIIERLREQVQNIE